MKAKTTSPKIKIKDWLVISRIRLTNFIKEHKYVSSVVGLFLISCIVGGVVYATTDDKYSGQVGVEGSFIVKDTSSSTDTDITKIKSFDSLVFDIPFKLLIKDLPSEESVIRGQVIIEATFNEGVDAAWYQGDENATYKFDNANRKLTATIYDVKVNEAVNQKLYLKVNNVSNGTNVTVNIKIKEGTASDFTDLGTKSVVAESEKVDLTAKIISGTAYKSADFSGGRYAPYGILVGFDKSVLKEENSLRGLYFDPNATLTMEAVQSFNGLVSQIELETKKDYFGVYDRSKNLINAPHYKYDPTQISVFDSGSVDSLEKSSKGASGEFIENISQDIYLVGDKVATVEKGNTYDEQGIKLSEDGAFICKTSNATCKRVITDKDGNELTNAEMVKTIGTYKVTYTYAHPNGTTTVFRTVNVINKQEGGTGVAVDENTYSLFGNSTINILKGTTYLDAGISKNGATTQFKGDKDADLTVVIKYDGEIVPTVDPQKSGKYTITYSITSLKTSEANILKRTVNVLESLPLTKSSTVKTHAIYMMASDKMETPTITVDDKEITCDSEKGCSVKYYDSITNNEISSIDPTRAGTYNAIYTVTDKNGFVIVAGNKINIQIKYDLKISGIKTNGSNYYVDGNFYAFGSYFVTAKSVRDPSVTGDISVNLRIGDVVSSPIINKEHSEGTKTNKLSLNNENLGKLSIYGNDDYISYGEEVVLRSEFTYTSDGDDNINSLTTRVPVNVATSTAPNPTGPFTMVEYSSNVEESKPYYINSEYSDKINVKYYGCEMDEASTSCNGDVTSYDSLDAFNDASSKNDKLKLAYLEYTTTNVAPGSKIDFRIRLKTTVGNQSGKVTLSSTSTYDGKTVSSDSSINVTAFKARTKVLVGESAQDIIIDGVNTSTSTWSIYPSVSLPAEIVNTNVAGINNLDQIVVTVTLPDGINYVYNDNYETPSINGKTLVYTIRGKKVNDWIDPIYFDTSYNINIPSGTKLSVNVEIQATSSKISDSSSAALRTTIRSIVYQNSEVVSFGMYTPYSAISKDTSFAVTSKLYNNSTIVRSNLDLVTLLPYNDVSNEKNAYTGSYKLSNIPKGSLCTTALPTIISNSDKLLSGEEITWEDCSKYESDDYTGVTAIRTNGININTGQSHEQNIKIEPVGNKTNDVYQLNGYLLIDSKGKRIVKNIGPLKVSVVSKKITGTVWEDFDANGIMDQSEKKVAGVTLKLYNSETDELVKTTTSDEKGNYSLSDLDSGKYYVVSEFNITKYGLSPYQVNYDKSITSSFTAVEQSETVDPENPTPVTDEEECTTEDCKEEEKPGETEPKNPIIRTAEIEITNNTRTISNVNLGLALRKVYAVKLSKYVTRVITTNKLGVSTIKDFGNVTLAKLDVKDLSNLSIKVVYTLELENIGYYPGYIYTIKDYVPDGMKFNDSYEENKGWVLNQNGYVENSTLFDQLIQGGEKKYLTIAFDVTRKEAGSFINYAVVDDDDLHILTVAGEQTEGGGLGE